LKTAKKIRSTDNIEELSDEEGKSAKQNEENPNKKKKIVKF
jgi:hypothetical protein